MAFSILGFIRNEFFSLLLLDIINNNVMLQNIFKAFVIPIKQLSLIFYMLVVSSIIYAHFGLAHFEESFEDADGSGGCHSGLSCFWKIAYQAVHNKGNVAALMTSGRKNGRGLDGAPDYQLIMLFELVFKIFVGILLFNTITGLILNTFGALRQADNRRADVLENTCFVNGLTRAAYDDMALQGV
jgi:hypothetical protein